MTVVPLRLPGHRGRAASLALAVALAMTSVVKANASFVRKHKAAIDALGPDIRTIQKSGDEG